MASSLFNISTYSRFNLSESESDIRVFVKEYGYRIRKQLAREEDALPSAFTSFVDNKLSETNLAWVLENEERYLKNTPNEKITNLNYLSEIGFICSMIYTPDGEFIIVGHSSGLIQGPKNQLNKFAWINENYKMFLKGTPNKVLFNRWYCSEMGAITSLTYCPNGFHIIVGHASGMIQMRHGTTGSVLSTLRSIQFPPKPIYALCYSLLEERICYAASADGNIYRIEIPNIVASVDTPPEYCIRADPALECLTTQFYGTPGISSNATPFITQRSPALSLGLSADQTKMIVGYADASIKVYDMETQEADLTYKVHKLRLQFIPKKLQRMHFGQVCALRCHDQQPFMFASGAWDNTLRIWDRRCKVGCTMTFEGVNICSDSIDLKRDHCITGSWQPTEALSVWDLVAKKRLNIIRVQNRRPDVDGEYIYACRYWNSNEFNRKGKYGIIGGSGTNCLEIINLHNRYIACSYPASGTIQAIASHNERIAFGGTAPVLHIVTFHDPKHEKYVLEVESDEERKTGIAWEGELDRSSLDFTEPYQPRYNTTSTASRPPASNISQPPISSISQHIS